MKFTQNTPVISPNTIGNVAVKVSGDPMAYGMGGKEYGAIAGAIGQMAKVAKEQQDDADAADVMEARNKIMGSLTESMYGEKGLLTNGIGENAKGLEGRVTDTVQKTFDSISKNYNIRVQRALRGNLSENMGNFQRIAAQQEGREFRKQKDSQYGITINNGLNMSMLNYQDENLLDSNINDLMKIVDYRAKDQGFNEMQRQQERRRVTTAVVSGAMQAAIDDNDLDTASIYADRYGRYMDQGELMKFQKVLRSEKRLVDEKNIANEIIARHIRPDGTYDIQAIDDEINKMALETKTVGGGGAYFADSGINDEIMAAAQEFNVDPALVAAVADVESNGNQNAVSSVGALGVMQLMPDTAASLGVNPNDRKQNIRGGAKYLRQMLDTFGGDITKAVAAYNAGPRAVKDYGGVPPYKETQNYVNKILGEGGTYSKYKEKNAVQPYSMPTQGSSIDEQVNNLKDTWKHGVIDWVGGVVKNKFKYNNPTISSAARSSAHNAEVSNSGDKSWHVHNDALDVVFDEGQNLTQEQKDELVNYFKGTGMFSEVLYHNYGSGWHLHLGGLKTSQAPQAGGSARTVNAHDSGWADRVRKLARAKIADAETYRKDQKKQKLENYWKQIQGTGSASEALDILSRVNASEDYQTANAVESMVQQKYRGIFNKGGGGSSRGGTRSSSSADSGYTGKSGKHYSTRQYEEAKETNRLYREHVKLQNQGLYKISDDEQGRAMKSAEITNDVENAAYDDDGIAAAARAYAENRGDFYGAINTLVEQVGMTQDEASRYISKYLEWHAEDEE